MAAGRGYTAAGFVIAVLSLTSLPSAQAKPQTFIGTITDNMCPMANHTQMQMGPTDADCVKACVAAHGAAYVLYDGKKAYELSDQKTPEQFAACASPAHSTRRRTRSRCSQSPRPSNPQIRRGRLKPAPTHEAEAAPTREARRRHGYRRLPVIPPSTPRRI